MTAGEQMFFLGAPLAHVVAYETQLRLRRSTESRRLARMSGLIARTSVQYAGRFPTLAATPA